MKPYRLTILPDRVIVTHRTPGQAITERTYIVRPDGHRVICSCPAFTYSHASLGKTCKHVRHLACVFGMKPIGEPLPDVRGDRFDRITAEFA